MAVRAVNLNKELKYISPDDPGKGTDDVTEFILRPLRAWEMALVQDKLAGMGAGAAMTGGDPDMRIHQAALMAVQLGLIGWTNFQDEDGDQIEWKGEKANIGGRSVMTTAPKLLDAIPMNDIFGMYQTLMGTAAPSEAERKN